MRLIGRLGVMVAATVWAWPALAVPPQPGDTIRLSVPASDVEAVQQRFDPLTGKLVPIVPGANAQPGARVQVAPMQGGMQLDPQTGLWRMMPDQPANRFNPTTGQWEMSQPGISVDVTVEDPKPASSSSPR